MMAAWGQRDNRGRSRDAVAWSNAGQLILGDSMSATEGRLGNLRITLTACAAALTLALHGPALGGEAGPTTAVAASFWDGQAHQGADAIFTMASLSDSPFLIEPPFPHADGAKGEDARARLSLTMADFMKMTAHPDGQQIAFSSRGIEHKDAELWVIENFLPTATARP